MIPMTRPLRKVLKWLAQRAPLAVRLRLVRTWMDKALRQAQTAGDPGAPGLLVVNHFFDQDVRALMKQAKRLRVVALSAPVAFRHASLLFPEPVRAIKAPYATSSPVVRRAYRRTCRRFLRKAQRRHGIEALAAPSDAFYWIRELYEAARELGMMVVVLDKEGTISPYDWEAEARRLRENAPFMSDRIYVWSRRQRDYWMRVGAPAEKIRVVGQPRSDLFFDPEEMRLPPDLPADRPLVTFYAFMVNAYIPIGHPMYDAGGWSGLRDGCCRAIAEAARERPDAQFVVKLHPQDEAEPFYVEAFRGVPNVRVLRDAKTGSVLLHHSRCVVAFQTTVVLEAAFVGRRVLYPGWDPLERELEEHLLPLRDLPHVVGAASPDHLRDQILACLRKAPKVPPRDTPYLEGCDGHVCKRILDDLAQAIA